MRLDNTAPCNQHVWQFKQKLFCDPFSNLTSIMKSRMNKKYYYMCDNMAPIVPLGKGKINCRYIEYYL